MSDLQGKWEPHIAAVLWNFISTEKDIIKLRIIRDLLTSTIEVREQEAGRP